MKLQPSNSSGVTINKYIYTVVGILHHKFQREKNVLSILA